MPWRQIQEKTGTPALKSTVLSQIFLISSPINQPQTISQQIRMAPHEAETKRPRKPTQP
ncbi:hypothetical protein HMPREF0577_2176 [Mobiluncus mulieris ATCC 35243]|nr:hypothetical protein HMPREF0577_2176 [Mobiluncus mulieris ATCC 35243]